MWLNTKAWFGGVLLLVAVFVVALNGVAYAADSAGTIEHALIIEDGRPPGMVQVEAYSPAAMRRWQAQVVRSDTRRQVKRAPPRWQLSYLALAKLQTGPDVG